MASILIINAHPRAGSYVDALVESYKAGLLESDSATGKNKEVEVLELRKLQFMPNLLSKLSEPIQALEPDLLAAQEKIAQAKHIVWVYPNWWGTMPALLKAFIDRAFLPGFAFKYRKNSQFVDKLLSGKTAGLIVSMDGPSFWYKLVMGAGGDKAMIKSTLGFCGIKTKTVYHAHSLRGSGPKPAIRHLARVKALAAKDAKLYL